MLYSTVDNEMLIYWWVLTFLLVSKCLLLALFKRKKALLEVISNAFLLLFMLALIFLERAVIFYRFNFTSVFILLIAMTFSFYLLYQIYKLSKKAHD